MTREIKELEIRGCLLKMCCDSLEGTKVIIYDISNRVGVITNIWQTVGNFPSARQFTSENRLADQLGHARAER